MNTMTPRTLVAFACATALLMAACADDQPDEDDNGTGAGGSTASSMNAGGSAGGGSELNEECAEGVAAFCFCLDDSGEPPCTDDERNGFYGSCDTGSDEGFFECFGSFVNSNNQIDCGAAVSSCG